MIDKYKACTLGRIELVQVVSETEKFVNLGNRRAAKMSDFECYFDTKQEAKDHLINRKLSQIEMAESRLKLLREDMQKLSKL